MQKLWPTILLFWIPLIPITVVAAYFMRTSINNHAGAIEILIPPTVVVAYLIFIAQQYAVLRTEPWPKIWANRWKLPLKFYKIFWLCQAAGLFAVAVSEFWTDPVSPLHSFGSDLAFLALALTAGQGFVALYTFPVAYGFVMLTSILLLPWRPKFLPTENSNHCENTGITLQKAGFTN